MQELPWHPCYLGSVFIDLLIRNLPGTALSHLIHCGLVFEAIVQPEGSDEFIKPLDAATQADSAEEEGSGQVWGCWGGTGKGRGVVTALAGVSG